MQYYTCITLNQICDKIKIAKYTPKSCDGESKLKCDYIRNNHASSKS